VTKNVPLTPPPTPLLTADKFSAPVKKTSNPLKRSALEEKLVAELKKKQQEDDQKIKEAAERIMKKNQEVKIRQEKEAQEEL
jgi:hypothetical protein